MFNAEMEGGPHNGVMTALDDFLAEYDRPVRKLVIPIYFGLAIVVDEEWFDRRPELASVLDRLESSEGQRDLMELAEDTRLRAMIFQHNIYYERQDRLERATQALPRRREVRVGRRALPRARAAPRVPHPLPR